VDTGSNITAVPGTEISHGEYVALLKLSRPQEEELQRESMSGRKVPVRLVAGDGIWWYTLGERSSTRNHVHIQARVQAPLVDFSNSLRVLVWPPLLEDAGTEGFVFAIVGTDLLFRKTGKDEPSICVCREAIRAGPRSLLCVLWRAISRLLSRFGG
jgi:hypothetical protein